MGQINTGGTLETGDTHVSNHNGVWQASGAGKKVYKVGQTFRGAYGKPLVIFCVVKRWFRMQNATKCAP